MAKYLDKSGVTYLWNKIKGLFTDQSLNTKNKTYAGAINEINTKVGNLTGAFLWKGKFDALPAVTNYEAGNVVGVGKKEYVLTVTEGTKAWEEFGDEGSYLLKTTAEETYETKADGNANRASITTIQTKLNSIESGANKTVITNNLTTSATGTALDASQGRILNSKIKKTAYTEFSDLTKLNTNLGSRLLYIGGNKTITAPITINSNINEIDFNGATLTVGSLAKTGISVITGHSHCIIKNLIVSGTWSVNTGVVNNIIDTFAGVENVSIKVRIDGTHYGRGFNSCQRLINCKAEIYGTNITAARAYNYCDYLYMCRVGSSHEGTGFHGCTNMDSCDVFKGYNLYAINECSNYTKVSYYVDDTRKYISDIDNVSSTSVSSKKISIDGTDISNIAKLSNVINDSSESVNSTIIINPSNKMPSKMGVVIGNADNGGTGYSDNPTIVVRNTSGNIFINDGHYNGVGCTTKYADFLAEQTDISTEVATSLEAITIKTSNSTTDKAANVAAIKAYVDNLKSLGVDTTKGYGVLCKYNDNGYIGICFPSETNSFRLCGIKPVDTTMGVFVIIETDGTYKTEQIITANKTLSSLTTTSKFLVPAINEVNTLAKGKQDALTSGTNIKTVNGQSLLGSGNITISGGGSGDVTKAGNNIFTGNNTFTTFVHFSRGIELTNANEDVHYYLDLDSNTNKFRISDDSDMDVEVTGVDTPIQNNSAANKSYVDSQISTALGTVLTQLQNI